MPGEGAGAPGGWQQPGPALSCWPALTGRAAGWAGLVRGRGGCSRLRRDRAPGTGLRAGPGRRAAAGCVAILSASPGRTCPCTPARRRAPGRGRRRCRTRDPARPGAGRLLPGTRLPLSRTFPRCRRGRASRLASQAMIRGSTGLPSARRTLISWYRARFAAGGEYRARQPRGDVAAARRGGASGRRAPAPGGRFRVERGGLALRRQARPGSSRGSAGRRARVGAQRPGEPRDIRRQVACRSGPSGRRDIGSRGRPSGACRAVSRAGARRATLRRWPASGSPRRRPGCGPVRGYGSRGGALPRWPR